MQCLTALEHDYDAAKSRLEAAQQEKLEAAAEFLAVRAALRQKMEALWPAPCPCGDNARYDMEAHTHIAKNEVAAIWV